MTILPGHGHHPTHLLRVDHGRQFHHLLGVYRLTTAYVAVCGVVIVVLAARGGAHRAVGAVSRGPAPVPPPSTGGPPCTS